MKSYELSSKSLFLFSCPLLQRLELSFHLLRLVLIQSQRGKEIAL